MEVPSSRCAAVMDVWGTVFSQTSPPPFLWWVSNQSWKRLWEARREALGLWVFSAACTELAGIVTHSRPPLHFPQYPLRLWDLVFHQLCGLPQKRRETRQLLLLIWFPGEALLPTPTLCKPQPSAAAGDVIRAQHVPCTRPGIRCRAWA